VKFFVVT